MLAPVNSPAPVFGVDVSRYQDDIDWKLAYALGKRFVSAEALQGSAQGPDAMFAKHRAASKAAGLLFCSYMFFRFDTDPIVQADKFLAVTGGVLPGELPLMLDVEWDNYSRQSKYHDGGQLDDDGADKVLACLQHLEQKTGMIPILYTSYYFFIGFSNPERFVRYIPWIAAYHTDLGHIKTPRPWAHTTFWQYDDNEKISGVDSIDGDEFLGTLDQLKAMAKPASSTAT